VAELGKLARPVVSTRARFHADQARRQRGNQLQQRVASDVGAHQSRLAAFIDAVHGKDVLGEIDSDGDNGHDFPSQVS
jgi:hypothetical protein